MKIRLQIVSIDVYLLGFFFRVRSTFKGRFCSILAMIHDQSYLSMIAIESRTHGDYEELTKSCIKCGSSDLVREIEQPRSRDFSGP